MTMQQRLYYVICAHGALIRTRSLAGSPHGRQSIKDSGGVAALVRALQGNTPAAMEAAAEACRYARLRCSVPGAEALPQPGDLHWKCQAPGLAARWIIHGVSTSVQRNPNVTC